MLECLGQSEVIDIYPSRLTGRDRHDTDTEDGDGDDVYLI